MKRSISIRVRRRSVFLLVAGLAACASVEVEEPVLAPSDVPIFAGKGGQQVALDRVLSAIDRADVVVFGEQHGHPAGLALHAELFRRSLDRHENAALCLEFLTREAQFLVDAYTGGLIDWDAFASACEGIRGTSPAPHRPLIDAAIAAGVPVVAANAPRIYTGAARAHGYERLADLSEEQARLFELPEEPASDAYREAFLEVIREHDQPPEGETPEEAEARLASYFRAQSVWDATMASSVADTLERGRSPVFLVVGSFHCNDDGGTVQRIRGRRPDAEVIVISVVAELRASLADEHRDLADYVAYVGPAPE